MEIRPLNTFLKVVEQQSFSKAAKELGYTQSAVTIQIQQLEKELDVHLFDRIGKNISLTHYGQEFIPYARDAVEAITRANFFTMENDHLTGKIRVGTIESLMTTYFEEILEDYHNQFPKVQIQLLVEPVASIDEKLLKNELDLIYTLDYQHEDPHKQKLFEAQEDILIVANRNHPILQRKRLLLKDIANEEFVLMLANNNYRYLFDTELLKQGLTVKPFLELDSTSMVIQLLRQGNFLSVLPRYAVQEEINKGKLEIVPVLDCQMSQYRQLEYHKSKVITPQIKGFVDACLHRMDFCE